MDAFIEKEAWVELKADTLGSGGKSRCGLLLGHRRGPRYFVSRAFPLGGRTFPVNACFRELDRLFAGRIIGFYATRPPDVGPSGILQAFAYGKLFLRVSRSGTRSRRLAVKPSVIEYDNRFFLSPIPLARRRP